MEPLPVVTSRYEPLLSWMAPKSLHLTTAFAPVPTFLGGSCPLGCSLSAPATGGFSMTSPQCSCMRQAPRRRSGPAAHFMGYHSTSVRICKGVLAGPSLGGGCCCGQRPPSAEGLLWPAPLSHLARPPTFLETGGHPLYPRRGLRPLHPWLGTKGVVVACALLYGMVWLGLRRLSHLAHPPTFLETGGTPPVPPAGAAPPAPRSASVASLRWRV